MRRFNPEKELKKIQNGNKNKILYVIILLLIISIGSTYALYQVRYSKRIIYTKVAPFSNRDINLAVYLDNNKEEHFPEKNSGYRYDHIDCDNGSTGTFDNIKWELTLTAKDKDKCDVYFVKTYKDASGANAPELYQGLIPVTISDNGTIEVADTSTDWYNYGDHRWANAVLVTESSYHNYISKKGIFKKGTTVDLENDVIHMLVWVPRYKYQLFNVEGKEMSPQMINIEFEHEIQSTGEATCTINNLGKETCEEAINDNWYTHPAFTFGSTELTGFWVGKFQCSDTLTALTTKPNRSISQGNYLSDAFNALRNVEKNYNILANEVDTHLIKNMDWGAMAYLTQSKYGRCNEMGECTEITVNATLISGYANTNDQWNTLDGFHASTTDNITGIYDMSGGYAHLVMMNVLGVDGSFQVSASKFNPSLNAKYYDKYSYWTSTSDFSNSHLGDAIREVTLQKNSKAWYNDLFSYASTINLPFGRRGGWSNHVGDDGLFWFSSTGGNDQSDSGLRLILTAQDGND